MYIIQDKETKKVLCDSPAAVDENLMGEDIYPHFNPDTMELLKTDIVDIAGQYDNLSKYYNVDENGYLRDKTVEEKLAQGLIESKDDLLGYATSEDAGGNAIPTVKLGLAHNLITTVDHCNIAFRELDEEFERRVAQKYRPGLEIKLMKDYFAWAMENKPAGDKREQKYLEMTAAIDAIKEDYKPVRAELKKIMLASPNIDWLKSKITAFMDAQHISYNASDTKQELLDKIAQSG